MEIVKSIDVSLKYKLSSVFLLKSLIIQEKTTKEVTSVKEVWKCDLNYHKIW